MSTSARNTTRTVGETVTEPPPPELPDEGIKTKLAFIENGEVFEQEDNFNNISGEAIVSVPPHGNLSELTVVLQPSTVSKPSLVIDTDHHIITGYQIDCSR